MEERAKTILDFWFIEATSEEKFSRNDDFDNKINVLFFEDYKKAITNKYDHWQKNAKECLALIILLDQFSRNLFRNNPKAFEMDHKAQIIAKNAIKQKFHEILTIEQIFFIFLPFMHSENLSDQSICIKLVDDYLKNHSNYGEIKKFAKIHYEIIEKFGRFPHRNKVLSRINTDKENDYLKSTHHGFFNI